MNNRDPLTPGILLHQLKPSRHRRKQLPAAQRWKPAMIDAEPRYPIRRRPSKIAGLRRQMLTELILEPMHRVRFIQCNRTGSKESIVRRKKLETPYIHSPNFVGNIPQRNRQSIVIDFTRKIVLPDQRINKIPGNRPRHHRPHQRLKSAKKKGHPLLHIDGIEPLFNNSDRLIKAFWILSLVCYSCFSLYSIGNCVATFYAGNVDVKTEVYFSDSTPIPTIILCPFSPFETNKFLDEWKKKYKTTFSVDPNSYSDLLRLPGVTMYDLWNAYGMEMDKVSLRLTCSNNPKDQSCLSSIHLNKINTTKGACLTIESQSELLNYGSITTLTFVFETEEYISRFMPGDMIHRVSALMDGESQIYLEIDDGLPASPFIETNINLKYIKRSNLNSPLHPCVNDKVASSCMLTCLQELIYSQVPCRLPFMTASLPDCREPEEFNRSIEITLASLRTQRERCVCPRICDDFIFIPFFDLVRRPKGYIGYKVTIFFDREIELINEVYQYTWNHLLSDVGGNLCFFLGISVLHVLEILEVFYNYLTRKKSS